MLANEKFVLKFFLDKICSKDQEIFVVLGMNLQNSRNIQVIQRMSIRQRIDESTGFLLQNLLISQIRCREEFIGFLLQNPLISQIRCRHGKISETTLSL